MNYLVNPTMALQPILDAAKPGDVIELAEGLYPKGVELRVSGTPEARITLTSVGRVEFQTPNAHNIVTNGESHWRFGWLHSSGSTSAFEITDGSRDIEIDGLKTDKNRFAVRIRLGSGIKVRHAYADHSNNAFKVIAGDDIFFHDCEAYRSFDDFDPNAVYKNGDGWIVERGVTNVALLRCKSGEHKDGGFDIKTKALLEDCIAYGNKNNFKLWGVGTVLRNCLSYDAKRQPKPGGYVEGNGITMESKDGVHAQVTAERCTFVSADNFNVHLYGDAQLTLKECVLLQEPPLGELLGRWNGPGRPIITSGNVWFDMGRAKPSYVPLTDRWENPGLHMETFLNRSGVGFAGVTPPIDALSWDTATPPAPSPVPTPPPTVPPAPTPTPVPPGAVVVTLPRKSASSSALRYADDKAKVTLTLPTKLLPGKPMKAKVIVEPAP